MADANTSDFLGEGTNGGVSAPKPRATDPTGLYYTDTGEPTPLYYQRKNVLSGSVTPGSAMGQQYQDAEDRRIWSPTPEQRADGWAMDPSSGLFTKDFGNGDRIAISNDRSNLGTAPAYTVQQTPDGLRVGPGQALPGDQALGGQRLATQAEADRANANIVATGESHPGGAGAMNPTITPGSLQDLQGLATAGSGKLDQLSRERGTAAQNMFAQGSAAQGRAAPQTSFVDYGAPQTIARTPGATTGNFGAEQSISAPTLAAARDAAMGNFGSAQTVRAATVAPAAQARASLAAAQQAQNQAGFLAGTAAGARSIDDLDFGLSNESRGALGASINRLNAYADAGPGESAAQAQLRQAQESNLGDALSLARSGRGNAAGNMKMALSENAATNAQTNMQAAQLRAQEADAWRSRQLQALGLAQEGTTNMRGQDIGQATAQGQHAISREQIASNVDVSRAGLEQQLAMNNAQLGTQANLTNAQLGTQTSIANAEQQNLGRRLQAQLSTDAGIQQAALANALNVARGQAGTQVNLQNAEQTNLNSRLGAQLQLDAATQQAQLANARNIAVGQAGTQTSISNADNAAARARATAELANQLAIAQGNSTTDLSGRNLDARVQTNANNDDLMAALYGYGTDLGRQQLDATNAGLGNTFDYANLVSNNEQRGLDRQAGINTANEDRQQRDKERKDKQNAAIISAVASGLAGLL